MFENVNNRNKKNFKYFGDNENYERTANGSKLADTRTPKPATKTISSFNTKYDSHSEIFKPTIKCHNTDFEYPLLSSRTSKYSNISSSSHQKKYLLSTSKNIKPSTSASKQSLAGKEPSIWGVHDPYHSLANEQLAKDYLSKNSTKRSDERAVETIMKNLEKERVNNTNKQIAAQQSTSDNKKNEATHDTQSTKSKIFNSINKWSNGLNKSSKELKRFISLNDSLLTSRSVNYLVKTSDQIVSKTTTSKKSDNILFNIIEKENTNFSIKSGYDTPLTCLDTGRASATHSYMDMLKTNTDKRQSSHPHKAVAVAAIESDYQVNLSISDEAELYQRLEFPSQINIYSTLEARSLSESHRQESSAKPVNSAVVRPLLRPKAGYQQRNTSYKTKSYSNSIMSFETEVNNSPEGVSNQIETIIISNSW